MRSGGDTFALREWLAADADPRSATDKSLSDGVTCDGSGCIARDAAGRILALAKQPSAFVDDCRNAVLIVPAAGATGLRRDGDRPQGSSGRVALALRIEGEAFIVEAAKPGWLYRPWARFGATEFADMLPSSEPAAMPARRRFTGR